MSGLVWSTVIHVTVTTTAPRHGQSIAMSGVQATARNSAEGTVL